MKSHGCTLQFTDTYQQTCHFQCGDQTSPPQNGGSGVEWTSGTGGMGEGTPNVILKDQMVYRETGMMQKVNIHATFIFFLLEHWVRFGKWDPDEDKRLKIAVKLFGAKNWNKIARFVHGRTQVQCRERWGNCLDPALKMGEWTPEEDLKLKHAIAEHGHIWSKIAACVPPRIQSQCLRRWDVLLPHDVPQRAKKMKKAALISNFVDQADE